MRALKRLNLDNVVFIDIETVGIVEELTPDHPVYDAWVYKIKRDGKNEEDAAELFSKTAALYPEFGKIVVISVGRIKGGELNLKSYSGEERDLLIEFTEDLQKVTDKNPKTLLCGQAIVGFDIPYLLRRCLANGIQPHDMLDTSDKKPWEVLDTLIDTNVLWKGTGFNGASLIAIASTLGLPSPKDDISGADVARVYYSEGQEGLDRIITYCEKDVLTVANVVRKCRFEDVLKPVHSLVDDSDIEKIPLVIKLFNGGKFGEKEQAELLEIYNNSKDKVKTMVVLEALTSTAKGKITNVTKAWLKTIK
jgi:uncharacterized protein YprB with RNaseH-like and TPR domain